MLQNTLDSDRAVSPVIGVILMVAIMVTLATVVGAFVMGIGGELMQPAPQVTMEAGDAEEKLVYSPPSGYYPCEPTEDNGENALYMEHRGGDEIEYENLRVKVSSANKSFQVVDKNMTDTTAYYSSPSATIETAGFIWNGTTDKQFSVGERVILSEYRQPDRGGCGDWEIPHGEYTVQVIHTPSQQIIYQQTISIK